MENLFDRPCRIRFTQSSIKSEFQNGKSLEATASELLCNTLEKNAMHLIKVVRHDGLLFALDNRRLAVFRLIELSGHLGSIKIKVAVIPKPKHEWRRKFETMNDGASIRVRGPQRFIISDTASCTTFPLSRIQVIPGRRHHIQEVALDSSEDDACPSAVACNRATRATYNHKPDWKGSHKCVAKGTYTEGERRGEACVVKWFRSGPVYSEADFKDDVKAIQEANRIIQAFNSQRCSNKKVHVNMAEVWTRLDGTNQKLLVEPFIEGAYIHFNSNTGFQCNGAETMAALSHFSYHFTNGQKVICDLQGGRSAVDNTYILTDPVILSQRREYGVTDLGPAGIQHFFSQHRCTKVCQTMWKRPSSCAPLFDVAQGSTLLIGDTLHYGSFRQRRNGTAVTLSSISEGASALPHDTNVVRRSQLPSVQEFIQEAGGRSSSTQVLKRSELPCVQQQGQREFSYKSTTAKRNERQPDYASAAVLVVILTLIPFIFMMFAGWQH